MPTTAPIPPKRAPRAAASAASARACASRARRANAMVDVPRRRAPRGSPGSARGPNTGAASNQAWSRARSRSASRQCGEIPSALLGLDRARRAAACRPLVSTSTRDRCSSDSRPAGNGRYSHGLRRRVAPLRALQGCEPLGGDRLGVGDDHVATDVAARRSPHPRTRAHVGARTADRGPAPGAERGGGCDIETVVCAASKPRTRPVPARPRSRPTVSVVPGAGAAQARFGDVDAIAPRSRPGLRSQRAGHRSLFGRQHVRHERRGARQPAAGQRGDARPARINADVEHACPSRRAPRPVNPASSSTNNAAVARACAWDVQFHQQRPVAGERALPHDDARLLLLQRHHSPRALPPASSVAHLATAVVSTTPWTRGRAGRVRSRVGGAQVGVVVAGAHVPLHGEARGRGLAPPRRRKVPVGRGPNCGIRVHGCQLLLIPAARFTGAPRGQMSRRTGGQ